MSCAATDGGATWHPQEIAAGSLRYGALVATSGLDAAALVDGTSVSGEPLDRLLFATTSGGEVAGTPATLALSTPRSSFSKRKLKAAHDSVRVTGTLCGALGGETIIVSRRNLDGGPWQQQTVVAGANGGSFTTTWHITELIGLRRPMGRRQRPSGPGLEGPEGHRQVIPA